MAICGKRRSGKTYFTKWLLRRIPKWIVWDYNFEYKMGDVIVYTLTDLRIQYRQGVKRIVYRPMSKTDEDFEAFCAEAFSYANVMIVVEEVERYATSWQIPFSLKRIVDVGGCFLFLKGVIESDSVSGLFFVWIPSLSLS